GGNAIDAAVAVGFAAGVVEPNETSLGGSGFMLIHTAEDARTWSVEFPPRAPIAARPDLYRVVEDSSAGLVGYAPVADAANSEGYLAPTVPATIAGLCLAHSRFG